jgi:hypothetical protein
MPLVTPNTSDLVLDLAFNGLGFALSPESSGVFDV